MKKKLVLIVLLLLANSFTLLAQINKTDTTASKTGAVKTPVPDTTAKPKTDKQADEKTAKPVIEKSTIDSIAKLPASAVNQSKPDTAHTVNNAPQLDVQKMQPDTGLTAKKDSGKKKNKKLSDKKSTPDSLSAKSKEKIRVKSAKELKREAKKNDINNLKPADLAKMAFQHMNTDSSGQKPVARHTDITLANARSFPLSEPAAYDINYFHRYWRDIDLQDSKNKKFLTYHADLINALLAAIKGKALKAYAPASASPENPYGDAFTVQIPYDQLMSGLSDTAVVNILDKDGNITGTKSVPNPFTPDKIAGYRIKEDVFYDKTRSRSITRIIGIAPLVKLTLSSGEVISVQPLCWLKYKDCRKIFVTIDIDPTKKTGESMDDVFLQRRFYGRIVQESNPEGKRIKDYKAELADQTAEADRMEKKVTVFKKGSWDYIMLNKSPAEAKPATPKKVAVKPAD